ncbi:uncharacterized protein LOC144115341 isoform X3 [Amblyomma americanum]
MASPCEEDIRAAAASAAAAEADESLDATLVANGSEASQSDDSVSVESAPSSSATMTPEKATKDRSLSDGRLARAAEPDVPVRGYKAIAKHSFAIMASVVAQWLSCRPADLKDEALVRRLEDRINDRTRHLDDHLRHAHIQLTLMQRTFIVGAPCLSNPARACQIECGGVCLGSCLGETSGYISYLHTFLLSRGNPDHVAGCFR